MKRRNVAKLSLIIVAVLAAVAVTGSSGTSDDRSGVAERSSEVEPSDPVGRLTG